MEPTRRKPSSPLIVREIDATTAPHTARPPAIPHDVVPIAAPIRRSPTLISSPPPPPDRRPPMPEKRVPVVESEPPERPSRVEQEEFRQAVHVQHKGFTAQIPAVVVTALITAVSAYLLRPQPAPAVPVECLTKLQFDESQRVRDEQISRRFDSLETDMSYVKITVRLVQDRLPAQK